MYQVRLELSAAEKRTALQVDTSLSAEREERRGALEEVRVGMRADLQEALGEFQKNIFNAQFGGWEEEDTEGELQQRDKGRAMLQKTVMQTLAKVEDFQSCYEQGTQHIKEGEVSDLCHTLGTLESRTQALSAHLDKVTGRCAAIEEARETSKAELYNGALAPYGRKCAESVGEAVERLGREASESVARLEGVVRSEREAREHAFAELQQLMLDLRSVVQGLAPAPGRPVGSPSWRMSSSSPTGAPLQEALAKVSSLLGTLEPEGSEAGAPPGKRSGQLESPDADDARRGPGLPMPAPQGIPRSIQPSL